MKTTIPQLLLGKPYLVHLHKKHAEVDLVQDGEWMKFTNVNKRDAAAMACIFEHLAEIL